MYIFLDDERRPGQVTWIEIPCIPVCMWNIVRNIEQFKELLDKALKAGITIKHISFDHDLADIHYGGDYSDEKTGMDCAKYLVDWCMDNDQPLPEWTVHSMNPVGVENINKLLLNFKDFLARS